MRTTLLLAGAGLLICLSCQDSSPVQDEAKGHLTFRVQVEEGTPNAVSEDSDGQTLWFGPEEHFELQYAGPSIDANGLPAIAFEIEEAQKADFTDMTVRCTDRALAIYVGDRFMCAPNVNGPLPGGGIILGGEKGFTLEERDRLILFLRGD